MAWNVTHSNFISALRLIVGELVGVGSDKPGILNKYFAACEKYRANGYSPPPEPFAAGFAWRDSITPDDFGGEPGRDGQANPRSENDHLDINKVYKAVLLAEAIRPLLGASTYEQYLAAEAAMRGLVQQHFAEAGAGPLTSILTTIPRG